MPPTSETTPASISSSVRESAGKPAVSAVTASAVGSRLMTMMSSDAEEEEGGCAAEGVGAAGDPEGTLRRNPVRLRLLGKAGMGRTRVEIEGGVGLGFGEREEMRGRGATGGAWSDIVAGGESTLRLGGDGTGASRSTGADGKGQTDSFAAFKWRIRKQSSRRILQHLRRSYSLLLALICELILSCII
jgi:hypothetical protein